MRTRKKSTTLAQVNDSQQKNKIQLQENISTKLDTVSSEEFSSRTRNFATILYEESVNPNWKQIINEHHLTGFAQFHDRDINPDGTQKKPHWHLILFFETVKNFETQVKPIFDEIGAVGRELVQSLRGYSRYLCHLDNPEKEEYKKESVISFGGADYETTIALPTDDLKALPEIQKYIRENEILSLSELCDLTALFKPEWYSLITMRKTYFIKEYIKSLRWEKTSGYVRLAERQDCNIDNETGEIIERRNENESND